MGWHYARQHHHIRNAIELRHRLDCIAVILGNTANPTVSVGNEHQNAQGSFALWDPVTLPGPHKRSPGGLRFHSHRAHGAFRRAAVVAVRPSAPHYVFRLF
jgi:hypothetical protein